MSSNSNSASETEEDVTLPSPSEGEEGSNGGQVAVPQDGAVAAVGGVAADDAQGAVALPSPEETEYPQNINRDRVAERRRADWNIKRYCFGSQGIVEHLVQGQLRSGTLSGSLSKCNEWRGQEQEVEKYRHGEIKLLKLKVRDQAKKPEPPKEKRVKSDQDSESPTNPPPPPTPAGGAPQMFQAATDDVAPSETADPPVSPQDGSGQNVGDESGVIQMDGGADVKSQASQEGAAEGGGGGADQQGEEDEREVVNQPEGGGNEGEPDQQEAIAVGAGEDGGEDGGAAAAANPPANNQNTSWFLEHLPDCLKPFYYFFHNICTHNPPALDAQNQPNQGQNDNGKAEISNSSLVTYNEKKDLQNLVDQL